VLRIIPKNKNKINFSFQSPIFELTLVLYKF